MAGCISLRLAIETEISPLTMLVHRSEKKTIIWATTFPTSNGACDIDGIKPGPASGGADGHTVAGGISDRIASKVQPRLAPIRAIIAACARSLCFAPRFQNLVGDDSARESWCLGVGHEACFVGVRVVQEEVCPPDSIACTNLQRMEFQEATLQGIARMGADKEIPQVVEVPWASF